MPASAVPILDRLQSFISPIEPATILPLAAKPDTAVEAPSPTAIMSRNSTSPNMAVPRSIAILLVKPAMLTRLKLSTNQPVPAKTKPLPVTLVKSQISNTTASKPLSVPIFMQLKHLELVTNN